MIDKMDKLSEIELKEELITTAEISNEQAGQLLELLKVIDVLMVSHVYSV